MTAEPLYVWRVKTVKPERRGALCRMLKRGRLNSCLIEFCSDGEQIITSRNYIRRAAASRPPRAPQNSAAAQ